MIIIPERLHSNLDADALNAVFWRSDADLRALLAAERSMLAGRMGRR